MGFVSMSLFYLAQYNPHVLVAAKANVYCDDAPWGRAVVAGRPSHQSRSSESTTMPHEAYHQDRSILYLTSDPHAVVYHNGAMILVESLGGRSCFTRRTQL